MDLFTVLTPPTLFPELVYSGEYSGVDPRYLRNPAVEDQRRFSNVPLPFSRPGSVFRSMWISVPGNYEYGFRGDLNRIPAGCGTQIALAPKSCSHHRNDFLNRFLDPKQATLDTG